MKENIYTMIKNRLPLRNATMAFCPKPALRARLRNTLTSIAILSSLTSVAQITSAYTIRNTDRAGNTVIAGQALTLSTLPSVTPRNNTNVAAGTPVMGSNAVLPGMPEVGNAIQRTAVKSAYGTTLVNPGNIMLTNTAAKLASFTGRAGNGQYLLEWETVIEENVKHYGVEFSANNRDFQSAGNVIAENKNTYSFVHVSDTRPTMYYRLKVTGTDGKFAYINALAIGSALVQPEDLVAPTIIRDGVLNVTLRNTYKNLQVFNSAGVEVFREYLGGRTGNRIGFNLPDLPAGAYFVKFLGPGTSVTQRVMIM